MSETDNRNNQASDGSNPVPNPELRGYYRIVGHFIFGFLILLWVCSYIPSPDNFWLALITGTVSYMVLLAMVVQTEVSEKQWHAMREALVESKITREVENAPFMAATGAKLYEPLTAGVDGQRINVRVVNSGRSPALNVRVRQHMTIDPIKMENFRPIFRDIPFKNQALLGPLGEIYVMYTIPTLEDIDLKDINNSKLFIYVWGAFEYDDRFGGHHFTVFAFCHRPGTKGFDFCLHGNECDYQHPNEDWYNFGLGSAN